MTDEHKPDRSDGEGSNASGEDVEGLIADYLDRLIAGEKLDPEDILQSHAGCGEQIVTELEAFIRLGHERDVSPLGTLGDYTLRRQIGRGGMGVVYEAWENSMDRPVALKVLPAAVAADPRAVMRFVREAQLAGKITHPNVVSVYGMGLREQTPYYAMEYVEGETLAQILRRLKEAAPEADTPFGTREGIRYFAALAEAFAAVADGLQQAHAKGVIHRDIKPSNLILDREGRLRILDFGLARFAGHEGLTATSDFLGTPLYMSPEQARRKKTPVDHRTDVYSLGATLYEVLVGRPPFQGKDHEDTLSQIIGRDPAEPRKISSSIPRNLETVVLKCLRKDPADRYGTAEALAQDLRRFARGDPVEAQPESRWEKSARWFRMHRFGVGIALALIVLSAAVGALLHKARDDAVRIAQDAQRIKLSQYLPDVGRAVQLMHFGTLSTRMGIERARRFDPTGFFVGEEARAALASPLLEAVEKLDQLAADVPSKPDALYIRARAFLLLGREREALEDLDHAIDVDGQFVPAFVLKAAIFEENGERDRAREELQKAERSATGGSAWATNLIAAYRAVDALDWETAARCFSSVLAEEDAEIERGGRERHVGSVAEVRMGRGMAHLKRGERGLMEAIIDFGVAQALLPKALDPVLLLGETLIVRGDRETAEKIFQIFHREAEPQRRDEVALCISARLFYLAENVRGLQWADRIDDEVIRTRARMPHLCMMDRSAEAVLEAERVPAGMGDARFCGNLAFSWLRQHEGDTVEALALKAIGIEERYSLMWSGLGRFAAARGDLEASQAKLERSLRCAETPYTFCYLAETLFLRGDRSRAEIEARRGEALLARYTVGSPRSRAPLHDSLVHRSLGALLEHRGRPREALEQYRKGIEIVPGEERIHARLGAMLRRERSSEFWEAADAALVLPTVALREEGIDPRRLGTMARALIHNPAKRLTDVALACARLAVENSGGKDADALAVLAEVQEKSEDIAGAVSTLEKAVALPNADASLVSVLASHRGRVPPDKASYETLDALLGDGGVETLVPEGGQWMFLRGSRQVPEGLPWTGADFDDTGWERGASPLGYGLAYFCATELDDMVGAYTSLYARTLFEVADPGAFQDLRLTVWAEDGLLAYVNGVEVGRIRIEPRTSDDTYEASPSGSRGKPWPPSYVVTIDRTKLSAGKNCLALHGVNHSGSQHGFFLEALLVGNLRPDLRRAEELLEALNREIRGAQGRPRIAYVEGRMLELAGRYLDAAGRFREVAALDPDEPLPPVRLARALRSAGRAREAEEGLRAALSRFPDHHALWDLWFEIAAVDLTFNPAEMLTGVGAGETASGGEARGAAACGGDMLWLLGRLQAGGAVRINCGGHDYTDASGNLWGWDRFFLGGWTSLDQLEEGSADGSRTDVPLDRAQRRFVARGDVPCGYRIPLPPGAYRVGLRFCERHYVRPGHRIFTVRMEGKEILTEHDPSAAGFAIPEVKTWNVVVEDGFLDVAVVPRVGVAGISAIEIECVR